MGIVEKIQSLVQGGNIKSALNELSNWAEKNDEDLYNTSILLMSRYNNLKRKSNMGLISEGEAERNENRLAFSILSTLEDIDESKSSTSTPGTVQQPYVPPTPVTNNPSSSEETTTPTPKKIFISYAREDEEWVKKLERHLTSLQRQGLVDSWNDTRIMPGTSWNDSIMQALQEADIYIFMVTVDFLASTFINEREVPMALQRHEEDASIRIVPVIVRPCDWSAEPYGQFQALPTDAKPLSTWSSEDEALFKVVQGIARLVK